MELMAGRRNKIDFIARYKSKDTQDLKKDGSGGLKVLLLVGAAVIILSLSGIKLYHWKFQQEPELNALNQYIDSEVNQKAYENAQNIIAHNSTIVGDLKNYQLGSQNIDSFPKFDASVYSALLADTSPYASINSLSFDGESGGITANFSTDDPQKAAHAVENLRSDGTFAAIFYYGYTSSESTGDTGGASVRTYNFTVICMIAAGGSTNG